VEASCTSTEVHSCPSSTPSSLSCSLWWHVCLISPHLGASNAPCPTPGGGTRWSGPSRGLLVLVASTLETPSVARTGLYLPLYLPTQYIHFISFLLNFSKFFTRHGMLMLIKKSKPGSSLHAFVSECNKFIKCKTINREKSPDTTHIFY
jgi:hypothetical protein